MAPAGKQIPATEPNFKTEAEFLARKMRNYSVNDLERLLKISPKLAEMNYNRYQDFDAPTTSSKQAILAYNGSVFKEIKAEQFSLADLEYAQGHLRIISTLYGLVRPLDRIKAYRIAYSLKLDGIEGKSLYDFWLPELTGPLIKDVQDSGGTLVNLASLDVMAALDMEKINSRVKVITPEFQVFRKGKYETVRTYAKMARGAMTRYIITNRTESEKRLQAFVWEGFKLNEKLSDEQRYIYTR